MKALSIRQPWASAIATGTKTVETRSWSTGYRGRLLIHASKTWKGFEYFPWDEPAAMFDELRIHDRGDIMLPFGALIAIAELVACYPITMRNGVGVLCLAGHERRDVSARETALGDFSPGRYGWVLRDVRPLPKPIPYSGRLGLFNVPDELIQEEFRS